MSRDREATDSEQAKEPGVGKAPTPGRDAGDEAEAPRFETLEEEAAEAEEAEGADEMERE